MLDSKTLGSAVGVQRQKIKDRKEPDLLSATNASLIVGRFKRGRMSSPFKVNQSNFEAVLGFDPGNPSYDMVEDALKLGISEVQVLRIGDSRARFVSGGEVEPEEPIECIPTSFTFSDYENTSDKLHVIMADAYFDGSATPLLVIAWSGDFISSSSLFRKMGNEAKDVASEISETVLVDELGAYLSLMSINKGVTITGLSGTGDGYLFKGDALLGLQFKEEASAVTLKAGISASDMMDRAIAEWGADPSEYEYIDLIDLMNSGDDISIVGCSTAKEPSVVFRVGSDYHAIYDGSIENAAGEVDTAAVLYVKPGDIVRVHVPPAVGGETLVINPNELFSESGWSGMGSICRVESSSNALEILTYGDSASYSLPPQGFYYDMEFAGAVTTIKYEGKLGIPNQVINTYGTPVAKVSMGFSGLSSMSFEWL